MDIRGYFSKKTEKKSPVKSKNKRRIIESSDESDQDDLSKRAKTEPGKNSTREKKKQLADSKAEASPLSKKQLGNQSKLKNVQVTSKFFKQTTAASMFGEEPIKRSSDKLKEIQEKIKSKKKKTANDELQIPDDDAEFAATVAQMDDLGPDNWVDWNKIESTRRESPRKKQSEMVEKVVSEAKSTKRESPRKKQSEINEKIEYEKSSRRESPRKKKSETNEKMESETKKTSKSNEKKKKDETNFVKSDKSKNSTKESLFVGDHALNNSSIDSGFDSQFSSQSQNTDKINRVQQKNSKKDSNVESPKLTKSDLSSEKLKGFSVEPKVVVSKLSETKQINIQHSIKQPMEMDEDASLWVEKHKPTNTKKIIGQQGDKSNVKKLIYWLENWSKNNVGSKKAAFVPSGFNKDPTGACFKAALLSGPPGVGKTTSVNLICKELAFDMVEFNASDTRSKKSLQEEVSRLLNNTSLMPYFSKDDSKHLVTKKHVLVMDEVDGMAGNEDRGGIQELIQLIKTTKVPIICMCNDRNHPKIRSLVNYCFDLRYSRPRVEQIKGYMRSICFKEKLNISNEALTDIITSANQDIRLILNHLSMLAADRSSLESSKKHIKLGAWDVLRKVFSEEEHKNMSIHDKCDLFFFDYSIAPLFVQENYLLVKPHNANANDKYKKMELFANAADSISMGDTVDKAIRGNMAWSLLPTQAIFASYAPGEILKGHCGGLINFPLWLGKNSRRNKIDRLLQEVQIHTRLKLSATKESINLDYASHLRNQILRPLIQDGTDGVQSALEMLHEYQLLKEDLDSLQEICQWPDSKNQMASLDSKVKAAFTRMYNKNAPVRPYSLMAPIQKGTSTTMEDLGLEDEENEDENKSDDDADAMIITKKKTQPSKRNATEASTSKTATKTSTSKRGRKK